LRRLAFWAGSAVALYALLGFLVAPPLVRSQLEKALSEQLGRPVSIERVRINPFALSASIHNFAVKERDGSTNAAGFDDLVVTVTVSSLYQGGVVAESVVLSKPYLRVARFTDGTYSFQDIVDRLAAAPPAPPGPSPRFALYNVRVSDGRIDFDDQPAKTRHAVTDLQIGLPFLSSLPAQVDIVELPRLSARVNGTSVDLAGETKPFKGTHEATLRIDIDDLELAKYLEYSPVPLRVRVPSGRLSTRLVLRYAEAAAGQQPTFALSGTADVQRFTIQQADGAPLATLGRLSVDLESFDVLKRRATIRSIVIEAPELDITRQKDGTFNLLAAFPAPSAEAHAEPGAESREPSFSLTIVEIMLSRGEVRLVDRTLPQPVRLSLNDVSLGIDGLSGAPESRANVKLNARINRAAPVEITGKVNLLSKNLFVDLSASEQDIDLRPMTPYSAMYAGYAIAKGKLSLKHAVKLEGSKLATENNIRLDQFSFGEKVPGPTATTLPVTLAVAVLRDRNGVINLDLPIAASIGEPELGGGKIIGREVGGVVRKAATEPFALLGSEFGGGEDLTYLEFAPGSAALDAAAQAKLKILAKALYERPALKLNASGRVAPEVDGAELKLAAAGKAVSEEDLQRLAQARAQAAKDWLVESGKVAAARIAVVAPGMNAGGIKDNGRPTRVDFALE
jgi:hypothetical protein